MNFRQKISLVKERNGVLRKRMSKAGHGANRSSAGEGHPRFKEDQSSRNVLGGSPSSARPKNGGFGRIVRCVFIIKKGENGTWRKVKGNAKERKKKDCDCGLQDSGRDKILSYGRKCHNRHGEC